MDALFPFFLEHGAVGLLALILLILYWKEKAEVRRLNALHTKTQETNQKCVTELHEQKLLQLDQIRLHQIQREQEFLAALQDVGAGALEAIDKCEIIATELRRLNNERPSH